MPDLSHANSEECENLSLKVLAVLRYSDDLTGENCESCSRKTKIERNCDMAEKEIQAYYHDALEIDINTCPLNCIFFGHYSFLDRYIYYTTTSAHMPNYDDCDSLFWNLYRKFDNYVNILKK